MARPASDLAAMIDAPTSTRTTLAALGSALRRAARAGLPVPKVRAEAYTFWGASLGRLDIADIDTAGLLTLGRPAGPEHKLIRYFMATLESHDVFYDVGANNGFYTALAVEMGCRTVHAFEPLDEHYARLTGVWRGHASVRVSRAALLDRVGLVAFHDFAGDLHSGASTTNPAVAARKGVTGRRTYVPSTTIDYYASAQPEPPTVLKIDVEGAEPEVLEGGLRTLEQHRPVVALEVWRDDPTGGRAAQLLCDLGYVPHLLDDQGGLLATPHTGLAAELPTEWDNVAFLPVERSSTHP